MTLKIHISRDFSFAEFEVEFDPTSLTGLPTNEQLCAIWDRLPGKDMQPIGPNGLRETPDSARRSARIEANRGERRADREPLATANQRRVLERYGQWEEGMTKSEASKILDRLGI